MNKSNNQKKAIITILGTIGGYCDKENPNRGIYNNSLSLAYYNSTIKEISNTKNINTLPILIKTYKDYEIISLYTSCAKDIQKKVLEAQNISYNFKNEWQIDDDMEFDNIFSKIDGLINSYDKVIIDVSHGYRHLPILMIVNTIMHNIESIDKIEKILFAKEIKKNIEYEIIDLKRYLDLANISYALTTFDKNYTVANNIKTSDKKLNNFLEELSVFSKHILANSIDELLKDSNKHKSITTKLINKIKEILKNEKHIFSHLKRVLVKTLDHLQAIDDIRNQPDYEKLYRLSINMYEKGYFLNSITLLSEAIGMYCTYIIKGLDATIEREINYYEEQAYKEKNNEKSYFKLYELYNQSKTIYHVKRFKGDFLYITNSRYIKNKNTKEKIENWNSKTDKLTTAIKYRLKKDESLVELIKNIDVIRNNLAHANSSKRLKDVESDIKNILKSYENIVLKEQK